MVILIVVGAVCFILGLGFAGILGARVKADLEIELMNVRNDLILARNKASRLEAAVSADLAKVKKKL